MMHDDWRGMLFSIMMAPVLLLFMLCGLATAGIGVFLEAVMSWSERRK